MPKIAVLDKQTIDQIAAGEVVEKPASVVKELVENAIDAGATAVTVDIKQGGITFIRITDNGCGIEKAQLPLAFMRHATSKITSAEDLQTIGSLGFRGEALSSISAVSQVEMVTKRREDLTGVRYCIDGGEEQSCEEVGAPDGTTIIVRNLFYNVPARAKFLKTPTTEGNYITSYMEQLALSHPQISFKYLLNGQLKFQTSGNNLVKEIIYQIYGRDIATELIEISHKDELLTLHGFIGKPVVSRGNRNFENYYVNGRYVKDRIIQKAIEESYRTHMMQHQYPFTCLFFGLSGSEVDVNVHPSKLQVRFSNQEQIYQTTKQVLIEGLRAAVLIPRMEAEEAVKRNAPVHMPEPFEKKRRQEFLERQRLQAPIRGGADRPLRTIRDEMSEKKTHEASVFRENTAYMNTGGPSDRRTEESVKPPFSGDFPHPEKPQDTQSGLKAEMGKKPEKADNPAGESKGMTGAVSAPEEGQAGDAKPEAENVSASENRQTADTNPGMENHPAAQKSEAQPSAEQLTLFDAEKGFPFSEKNRPLYRIIGQLFNTYWLIELDHCLYIIDQHAAHEKVNYERMMAQHRERKILAQMISPPIVIHPSMQERQLLLDYTDVFAEFGFEIEEFGQGAFCIRSVPHNLYGIATDRLFTEILSECADGFEKTDSRELIGERIATMACKAAVKGNNRLSVAEVQKLLDELLTLENPYQCPHGRPTIIRMTQTELEKKFRRIV